MDPAPSKLIVTQRLGQLERVLPAAGQGDPVAVHRARVASRRLREVLPVVARHKRGRALRKATRRVTRALGPVRELDVSMETLAEYAAEMRWSRDSVARVMWAIGEERRRLCAGLQRRLERCNIAARGARALDATAATGEPETVQALLVDAQARSARRAIELRVATESAAGLYLPERLHGVRIGVKKLRYALELEQQLRAIRRRAPTMPASRVAKAAAARLRTLRRVQNQLGRMHDLEVLIARIRALQGTAAVAGLRVSADLDQLVRRLENECRDLHGKYVATRREVLAISRRAEAVAERHERAARRDVH
jgi:CHAD domain-containing protein